MNYDFQTIANLIGGFFILVFFLWKGGVALCKETGWVRKKTAEKKERERLDRKCEFEEFSEELVENFTATVIEQMRRDSQERDEKLKTLIHSTNNLLRREIIRIYHDYSPYKQIHQYNKEFLTLLYADYHKQGGNSFIDGLWEEMKTWQVVASTTIIGREQDKSIKAFEEKEI